MVMIKPTRDTSIRMHGENIERFCGIISFEDIAVHGGLAAHTRVLMIFLFTNENNEGIRTTKHK